MDSPGGPSFSSGLLSGGASPSGDEGFFPFVLERRDSFLGGGPGPEEPEDLALQLQQKEKDLLLAAELGKMLLERNEELRRQLETLNAQHLEHEEVSWPGTDGGRRQGWDRREEPSAKRGEGERTHGRPMRLKQIWAGKPGRGQACSPNTPEAEKDYIQDLSLEKKSQAW